MQQIDASNRPLDIVPVLSFAADPSAIAACFHEEHRISNSVDPLQSTEDQRAVLCFAKFPPSVPVSSSAPSLESSGKDGDVQKRSDDSSIGGAGVSGTTASSPSGNSDDTNGDDGSQPSMGWIVVSQAWLDSKKFESKPDDAVRIHGAADEFRKFLAQDLRNCLALDSSQ